MIYRKIILLIVMICHVNIVHASNNALSVKELAQKLELLHSKNDVERLAATLFLAKYKIKENPVRTLELLDQAEKINHKYSKNIINFFRIEAFAELNRHDSVLEYSKKILKEPLSKRWKKIIYESAIESSYRVENYEEVVTFYKSYKEFLHPKKHLHLSLKQVAESFQELDMIKEEIEVLESLTAFAPDTEESIWAIVRLRSYACRGEYFFSNRLLKQLSWNSQVHQGLKDYIIAMLGTKLRYYDSEPKYLSPFEIAKQLESYRFFNEARDAYEGLFYLKSTTKQNKIIALYQLGKIYIKLGKPKKAEEKFKTLATKYKGFRSDRVKSWLADSYRYQGQFEKAADVYSQIAEGSDSYTNWQKFWATYRAGDFEGAMELLSIEGLNLDRDKNGSTLKKYWMSKIYKKLGEEEKSLKLMSELLTKNIDSFYSTISIFNNPDALNDNLDTRSNASTDNLEQDDLQVLESKNAEIIFSQYLAKHDMSESVASLFNDRRKILKKYKSSPSDILKIHSTFSAAKYYTPQSSWLHAAGFGKKRYKGISEKINNQKQDKMNWKLFYPLAYVDHAKKFGKQYNIDPLIVLSIMRAESYYREHARSTVGARGLLQIMPFTGIRIAKDLGDASLEFEGLIEPQKTIRYGSFYFSKLYQAYDQNLYAALAAYNAGPRVVNDWLKSCQGCEPDEFIESIPYRETRRYVKKISRFLLNYQLLYKQGHVRKIWPIISNKIPSLEGLY